VPCAGLAARPLTCLQNRLPQVCAFDNTYSHTTRCCLHQCWVARRVAVACHHLHCSSRLLTRPVRMASIASSRTDSPMVVTTKQCECGNRFHTQCLSLSFMDAETQVESHVNMDQRNLGSCLLQHARQDVDRDSPAKNTRGQESAVNTKNKNVRGKSITKVSVQYLHMQECLVYAAVDVLQQAFEGASMFHYGNKTQAFTKIRRLQ